METIATVRARAQRGESRHQRAIEHVTGGLGRPSSIYAVLTTVVLWVFLNLGLDLYGFSPIDPPPFFWLQGCIALAGLITAIMVLTTQIRQSRHAEERAHLDLQVNLAAEQKTAKLVSLLEELRRDMPNVRDRLDPVADAMSEAVDPSAVMSALKDTFEDEEDLADPDITQPPSSTNPPSR